jgi:hypothetical protein
MTISTAEGLAFEIYADSSTGQFGPEQLIPRGERASSERCLRLNVRPSWRRRDRRAGRALTALTFTTSVTHAARTSPMKVCIRRRSGPRCGVHALAEANRAPAEAMDRVVADLRSRRADAGRKSS